MKPPIGGPITGPSSEGMVSTDMARTRSCLGVEREQHQAPDRPHHRPGRALAEPRRQQLRQVLARSRRRRRRAA